MQIKANKDVRDYQTQVFFGMDLRQLIFTVLAAASAIGCWSLFRESLGGEAVSWLCILCALPFGAFGFVRWHGMYLERLLPALFRSRVLHRDTLYFRTDCPEKRFIEICIQEEKANASKRKKGKKSTP